MRGFSTTVLAGIALAVSVWGSSAAASARPATAVTREMVVTRALRYEHARYAKTGSSPKTGFSCIGFVWFIYQGLGIDMPGSLSTAIAAYPKVPEADLLPGDIIFFQNTVWKGLSHVGIYIGDGKMISAEDYRRGVAVAQLQNDPVEGSYWQQHYLVAERPLGGPTPSATSATGPRLSVSVPSLNLRNDHSLNAIVETVLPHGTALTELGTWGQWLHVSMQSGLEGWVVQAGVTQTSTPASKPHPIVPTYPVLAGVNIHSGPSVDDAIVAVTAPNWRVEVLGSSGDFLHVRLTDGRTGWVLARFVSRTAPPSNTPKRPPTGRLTITAHIRTGPSLTAHIIQWVPAGTRVRILARVPQWDRVRVNRHLSGYIYAQYVTG